MEFSKVYISIIGGLAFTIFVGVGDFLQSILTRKMGRHKTLFLRFVMTLILLAPLCLIFHYGGRLKFDYTGIIWLAIGTVFYLVGYINYLKAFEIGDVSVVSPISSAGAAITVVLSALFLNEVLSAVSYFWIAVIMIGIGLTSTDIRKIKAGGSSKGIKESLITMLLFGIYFFTIGAAGKRLDTLNLFVFALSIQALIFSAYNFLKAGKISFSELRGKNLFLFIFITFLYAFAWLGFNYGASRGIISIVSPVSALYPIITILLATVFYAEKLAPNQIIGICLTLGALILLNINL